MLKKLLGYFMKKLQKKRQIKQFPGEKLIKKKANKLCVSWKDDDNSFIRWINEKRYLLTRPRQFW